MNHRLKKMRKIIIIIVLTTIVVFGTSGCGSRYYRGDYPELVTVATNSLLSARGAAPGWISDPGITILERDEYGRTIFLYTEGVEFGVSASVLISQKSDGNYVYFYPHYNFVNFEIFSEITSRVTIDGPCTHVSAITSNRKSKNDELL